MFVSNFHTINLKIISQIGFCDFVDKYHNTSTITKKEGLNSQEDRNLISCQHSSKDVLINKRTVLLENIHFHLAKIRKFPI